MGAFTRFLRSFVHAARGLAVGFRTQRSLRVHAVAAAIVVGLGLWHRVERWEWCALLLACGLVVAAELGNTAIELRVRTQYLDFLPLLLRYRRQVLRGA